jgi:hypothetical protein
LCWQTVEQQFIPALAIASSVMVHFMTDRQPMKKAILILLFLLLETFSFAQTEEKWKEGSGFNSVFQNLDSGFFKGTTNGILIIEGADGRQTILDFQGSEGKLNIIKDEDEVYDVSTKEYSGKTTSGITEIKYETYSTANGISIYLDGQWFEISAIDGACDIAVNGIEYSYYIDKNTEYLLLQISRPIELTNWQYIIQTEHTMEPNNINELKPKKKSMKILPNSTIIFAIVR